MSIEQLALSVRSRRTAEPLIVVYLVLDRSAFSMTPDPPDDDKCQVPMCNQTHFTYCPHCKLFVCIEHLNEHYSNYRQEYQSLLNDGIQQQILNRQFLGDIENGKDEMSQFFQREVDYYEKAERYFRDKAAQVTIRPQDCADLRSHIAQSSQQRMKFRKFMYHIHQLINDYEHQQPNGIAEGTRVYRSSL